MDQKTAAPLIKPPPTTEDELLADALRHAADVDQALRKIESELKAKLETASCDDNEFSRLRQTLENVSWLRQMLESRRLEQSHGVGS